MPSKRAFERNIRLFYVVRFMRYAQLWVPVWVLYLTHEQGFSFTQITGADAAFFLAITVLEVPTGAVADRWGRGKSVGLGLLSLAVALVVFAYTTSYPILLASFLIWALAEALASGADLALLFDSLKALGREHEYERHAGRGEAAVLAGVALATILGGPVATVTSTQATILIGAGTTALTAIAAFAMKEAPHLSDAAQRASYLANMKLAFRFVAGHPDIRSIVVLAAVIAAGLGTQMYLVQPFLLQEGVDVGLRFSLFQLPIQLAGIVGALLAARFVVRAGETRVLPTIIVGGTLSLFAVWMTGSLIAFLFIPLVGMFEAMTWPVTTGYVNRRVPSEQRATILSMQSFVRSLFVAPLAISVGVIADSRGIEAPYGFLAVFLALAGATAFTMWLRTNRSSSLSIAPVPATASGS